MSIINKECRNCKWFDCKLFDGGYCKRFPPMPHLDPNTYKNEFMSVYPKVMCGDFCGEFKRNKQNHNKINFGVWIKKFFNKH